MISQSAIQTILGIKEKTFIHSADMAKEMTVAFYPQTKVVSNNILQAQTLLREKLMSFGVKEIPYSDVFVKMDTKKRFKRRIKLYLNNALSVLKKMSGQKEVFFIDNKTIKNLTAKFKYKSGVCIIVPGELETHDLPMQYIKSFKDNSIISILDFPEDVDENSSFEHHFDVSMGMFAHNMANIVLAVDSSRWMIYNFNASHPIFNFKDSDRLNYYILNGLIPKVVAPISPHRISEFKILETKYDPDDILHKTALLDLQEGSQLYGQTNLFPKGKKIHDLKFRNNFHRQIGKIHLDSRSGMSFGFTAKQMPVEVSPSKELSIDEKNELYQNGIDFRTETDGSIFIVSEIKNKFIETKIPEVWVLTLRSGSDKTNFNPRTDIIKMGLKNGKMLIQLSKDIKSLQVNYKPSFDTKVILAHAVGNAINASISKLFNFSENFVDTVEHEGFSISHWHGYFKEDLIPPFVYQYGKDKPHVACSSPQSAIYALDGKLNNFRSVLESNRAYVGDIHVEPHHGSNICYPKLTDLVNYILENKDSTMLGNRYL